MTESVTTHPKNLDALASAMTSVITSEPVMSSIRKICKQILLDRDVQQIVGVSMAQISKEATKNIFSWNPREAEEARMALLRRDGDAGGYEKDEGRGDEQAGGARSGRDNPINQWFRGVQMALDPRESSKASAVRRERSQNERVSGHIAPLDEGSPKVAVKQVRAVDSGVCLSPKRRGPHRPPQRELRPEQATTSPEPNNSKAGSPSSRKRSTSS